jgi:hypothetical protein
MRVETSGELIGREGIVAGGNRCVRGENALIADGCGGVFP